MVEEKTESLKSANTLILIVVFALMPIGIWILNGSIYSHIALYFGVAREIITLVSGLAVLVIAIIALRKPVWLEERLMFAVAAGCSVASFLILLLAIPAQNEALTVVGLAFESVGGAWAATLTALALCSRCNLQTAVMSIALGYAIGELVCMFAPLPQLELGIVLYCSMSLFGIIVLYRMSSGLLDEINRGEAATDLELSNPQSFLSPVHPLFLCTLLFYFAFGFGIAFDEIDHAPLLVGFAGVIVIAAALWLAFGKKHEKADSLFSVSALLVIAGFLAAPLPFFVEFISANALMRIGSTIFEMLLWIVIIAVGRRNLFALLPTLGFSRIMIAIGTDAGAIVGHTTNGFIGVNDQFAPTVVAITVFVFVAFLWIGFRKFSFDATIHGVATLDTIVVPQLPDTIEQSCQIIGGEFGLTEREIEVFAMLARGRNGQFLREHFTVSRNTIKSHIRHIYQKLDVHSQQELIDLVESYFG